MTKSHHPCLVVSLPLEVRICSRRLVIRINTPRNLGGIKTHGMQGGLENSLLLVERERVLLGNHVQPLHACVPATLDARVDVPCYASNSRVLDVKLQRVQIASLGILGVPCVDVQEKKVSMGSDDPVLPKAPK